MNTLLSQLADLANTPLPTEVSNRIPARIIDIVGIAVRATQLKTSQAVKRFVLEQAALGQSTAIGTGLATAPAEAAFMNGVLAHSLDFDDTHLPSILHPSASVVPAALAIAEAKPTCGSDLLAAVALGLEVAVRLGMGGYDASARQSVFFERGQHATSICGSVGSAAAAARLLALDESTIRHAMAIACSMSSGIIEANRAGGTVKRLHCGWAARAGVTAAQLAAHGVTGPPTAIEGRFGLMQAFLGEQANLSAITADLGQRWLCDRIFYKPYPANHFTHTAIDAAFALQHRGLDCTSLKRATLEVAPPTVRTIGEPIDAKRNPQSGYFAQFSGPYAVVVGMLSSRDRGVGLEEFTDELANDPQRRDLMAKVDVVGDPKLMKYYPNHFPARLTVTTTSGETLVEEVLTNLGSPERPLTQAQLLAKYYHNTSGLLPKETIKQTHLALSSLATLRSTSKLLSPLANLQPEITREFQTNQRGKQA